MLGVLGMHLGMYEGGGAVGEEDVIMLTIFFSDHLLSADNKFSCTTQIEEDLLVFFFLIYFLFLDLYVCLYIIP